LEESANFNRIQAESKRLSNYEPQIKRLKEEEKPSKIVLS
jgi:hypothetical protein